MDIDKFGEIIDEFLKVNHVQMLIDMPEGTEDVTIKDNVGMGPTVHFYILLQALTSNKFYEAVCVFSHAAFNFKEVEYAGKKNGAKRGACRIYKKKRRACRL